MNKQKYLSAEKNNDIYIKLSGNLRYTESGPFETYIQTKILNNSKIKTLEVDLTTAEFLDSTHLGMVATLAVFFLQLRGKKMKIHILAGDIETLLTSSGLDEIAELEEDESSSDLEPKKKLRKIDEKKADLKKTMINAHETLAKINTKNKIIYQSVVDALKKN